MSKDIAVPVAGDHHRFAESLVESGEFDSVDAVVAAGLERLREEREERDSGLRGVADEIRSRAALPDEEFLPIETLDVAEIVARAIKRRSGGSS